MKLLQINGHRFLIDADRNIFEADYRQDPNGKPGELITRWNLCNRIDEIPTSIFNDLGEEQEYTTRDIEVKYCYITPDGRPADYNTETKYTFLATELRDRYEDPYLISEMIDPDGEKTVIGWTKRQNTPTNGRTSAPPNSRTHDEITRIFRSAFSEEMNDRHGHQWTDADTERANDTIINGIHRY